MKSGQEVRRKVWRRDPASASTDYAHIYLDTVVPGMAPVLVSVNEQGACHAYTAAHADLLAEDWELV